MNLPPQTVWMPFLLNMAQYIDSRVSGTGRHSFQVAKWTIATAQELEMDTSGLKPLYWAARLHDLGKIGVPENVLTKAGPLSDHEWNVMRLHPTVGANIVLNTQNFAHLAPMIRAHQERFDGTGYPFGLRGDAIPLGARILAVVDAYDAMVNDRVYRKARSPIEATRELLAYQGRHFDPLVVRAFLAALRRHG